MLTAALIFVQQFRIVATDRAERDVAVAADHFRQAFHDQVRPHFQRLCQHRRREGVVHHQASRCLPAKLGQRRNIDDTQQRIGHRLDEKDARILGQGTGDGFQVIAIDEFRLDAEAAQLLIQQLHGAAIEAIAGHDPLALLHRCEQQGADRRHAGAADDAPLGALDVRQALGQQPGVGMGIAGIDKARLAVGQNAVESVEVRQSVNRRLIKRRDQGAERPSDGVSIKNILFENRGERKSERQSEIYWIHGRVDGFLIKRGASAKVFIQCPFFPQFPA